jgi:hypothetical protein
MKFFILFAFIVACASAYKPVKTEPFVNEWVTDYGVKDSLTISNYKLYLSSVESTFASQDKLQAFDAYLTSVNNAHQLITHTEFMLPQRYRMENGRGRPINTPKYQQYKKNKLAEVRHRLDKEREEKFLKPLGEKALHRIKKNYAKFQGEFLEFPL